MDQQHYTNTRLAEETGLSDGTVKRLLKGCPTTYVTASLLSMTLGVTVDELISDETSESDQEETIEMTAEEVWKTLEKLYLERIADLKAVIVRMSREFRVAVMIAVVLMAFICFLFAFDIINPTVGWIQR
jgi:nucleoside permease NupC|nr:MAG TPA: LAMBDA REPRESSOR (TRIPLE MUTANT)/DNA COMPLEX-DNA COMPLEX, DOUBLE HELIX, TRANSCRIPTION-DNA.1A [Caudoviricetes sp.]